MKMSSADDDAKTDAGVPRTLLIKGGRVLVLDGKTPAAEAVSMWTREAARVLAGTTWGRSGPASMPT